MTSNGKGLIRLLVTLIATAVAFCLGGLAAGWCCERWVVPVWARQYPHDGQLGLGVMEYAIFGAICSALVVLVLGIIWTARSTSRAMESNDPALSLNSTDPEK